VLDGITSTVYLYGFDTTREPFDDPRVRRAISLSIDRERLADDVMQGTRVPATAIVPPSDPRGPEPTRAITASTIRRRAQAPSSSRAEIELTELQLTHNRGRTHTAIAEAMASDLEAALGVTVDLQVRDLQPFVQGVRRGEIPFFRLGWESSEPDPGAYLYPLFHSSQVGLDNLTRYSDEEVDELLWTRPSARRS
jgi:ABC-type oligopeptide transport system substrate-binding subunit